MGSKLDSNPMPEPEAIVEEGTAKLPGTQPPDNDELHGLIAALRATHLHGGGGTVTQQVLGCLEKGPMGTRVYRQVRRMPNGTRRIVYVDPEELHNK